MLIILSRLAMAGALVMAFGAAVFAYRAAPEARRISHAEQAMAVCEDHRALLAGQIPAHFPEWRQARMRLELPDCWELPRAFWWRGRVKRAAALFIAACGAFAFAALAVAAERAARTVEG